MPRSRSGSGAPPPAPLPVGGVLEALTVAAALFDASGTLVEASSLAGVYLGRAAADLPGLTYAEWQGILRELCPGFPEPPAEADAAWSERLSTAGIPRRVYQLESRPVKAAGAVVGRLETLRNITRGADWEDERARLESKHAREISRLEARLEEFETLKMELTANVSHDLRTPLASIKAAVSGLRAGDITYDPAQLKEILALIEEETDRLQRRVQNLLAMARMESGGAEPIRDWVDLTDVAGSVVDSLRGLLGDRSVRLDFPDDLPMVLADYDQVQIALRNLVENALLYSPPGAAVEITAGASLGQVRVRVRDYGPGLMPDEFERVFDKFYRGRAARRIPGTGLGLPICRGIAEAHGGRLWAEHAPGGGVAFVLSLPTDPEPQETEVG
jgi:signal transduction histidine kinase